MSAIWLQVSWDSVRASGFTAYLLLSASVVLGLLLSLRWSSKRWPRLITNDMHNFVTLLAIAFGMVHGVLAWLDPFTRFHLAEVLVPLASHYRPLWMAFGIVALYLAMALVLSTWLRPWIGYKLWRALHVAAFLAFAFTTLHGLGTGSDTRTAWGATIYGVSILAVLSLTTWRLVRPAGKRARPRPALAALSSAAAVVLALWAWSGPFKAGWNAIANNGLGSGARIALAAPAPAATMPASFTSAFSGAMQVGQGQGQDGFGDDGGGSVDVSITATLTGKPGGALAVLVVGQQTYGGVAIQKSQVILYAADGTEAYTGTITGTQGQDLIARVKPVSGKGGARVLTIGWQGQGQSVTGEVTSRPVGAAALSPSTAPGAGSQGA